MGQSQQTSVIDSTCDPKSFQTELDDYKFRDTHKILKNDFNYTINTKVADVICTCKNKHTAKKILPTTGNNLEHKIVVYPQCPRVLFTSFMRQLRENDATKVKPKIVK